LNVIVQITARHEKIPRPRSPVGLDPEALRLWWRPDLVEQGSIPSLSQLPTVYD
jgi:hypothetical protein